MNRIGLIGVGKMGLPLLNNLVKHGYYVNTLLRDNTTTIKNTTGQTFFANDINSFISKSDTIISVLPKSSDTLNLVSKIKDVNNLKVYETIHNADAVCFDVDSTIINEEGINTLAKFLGKSSEINKLTELAMDGNMDFRESIQKRLNIMKPSRTSINDCMKANPPQINPGTLELIKDLQQNGKTVFLISGGFRLMIKPIAAALGIIDDHVYANTLFFDKEGKYSSFNINEPTSTSEGKTKVITKLKEKYGYKSVVMIGDGYTDLMTKKVADAFIGFGGNIVRPNIRKESDWYVYSMDEIRRVFNNKHLLPKNKTWIDLCSSCPKDVIKINRILDYNNIGYIDAPMSGGPEGMKKSNITTVVSGPSDVYQNNLNLLRLYSNKVIYASENIGTASMIKLANNTLLALNLVSTSEVMNVLKKNKIDIHSALEFINNSSGKSHVSSQRYPDNILNGKHNFGFSYELHKKDVITFFNNSYIYTDSMLEVLHRIYNDPKNNKLNDHTEIVNYWKS